MENIHPILETIKHSDLDSILSTIIHVKGSAYLREGSTMLIQKDGSQVGMVSAGCLENDLHVRAEDIFLKKTAHSFTYNLFNEDDLTWGYGTGCNGILTILLEPVDSLLKTHLLQLKDLLDSGKTVHHFKKLSNKLNVLEYVFITRNGEIFGNWKDDIPVQLTDIAKHASENQRRLQSMNESCFLFYQTFSPKPRLIIFGAGPDAKPLASMAAQTGFSTIVCDWRPALCNRDHFPSADTLIIGFPHEIWSELKITCNDFAVIMTHQFEKDREILSYLFKKKIRYLGILGSRKRTDRLINNDTRPDWIHSPVGLAIGAIGPEEIAISILAEIIQIQRTTVADGVLIHE